MKIQNITNQQLNNKENLKQQDKVRFTGAFDAVSTGLRFLDTNQAWGANAVDLCSMVIPRTTVDFINRGPAAGTETMRRESCGTANHSLVGVYGTFAGMLVALGFNSKYGIKAHKLFADNATTDILAMNWHNAVHKKENDPLKSYLSNVFDNVKVFNTSIDKEKGWIGIAENDKKIVVDAFFDKLKKSPDKTINKEFHNYIHNIITSSTGGESSVMLESFGKKADNKLGTLIDNIYNLSKTFMQEKVAKTFETTANYKDNKFVKSLKNMNIKRSALGLGIASGIGMSIQPINMYLTKKKTGSDGFVGVAGRKKDSSAEFKIMKTLGSVIFGLCAIATITTNPKKLLSKIQFQGMSPTMNQLKLVYGLTIASRLMVARDKDELRESAVKDSLGFLNLLVLGTLVTKGAAKLLDKTGSLINITKSNDKGIVSWLKHSSLKTRDEVLLSALKQHGIDAVKGGKATKFKDLMKLTENLPDVEKSLLRGKLRSLNIAQIVGYLYSALVLGVALPRVNIYMTNKADAKRKAKLAEQNGTNPALSTQVESSEIKSKIVKNPNEDVKDVMQEQNDARNAMLSPENLAFLSKQM